MTVYKYKRTQFDGNDSGDEDAPKVVQKNPALCWVEGCNLNASVSRGGGRFMCLCHDDKETDDWPKITERIREHEWLLEFISTIRSVIYRPQCIGDKVYESWVHIADAFWIDSDRYCMPSEFEKTNHGMYLYRMLTELRYRVGSTPTRMRRKEVSTAPVFNGNRFADILGLEAIK